MKAMGLRTHVEYTTGTGTNKLKENEKEESRYTNNKRTHIGMTLETTKINFKLNQIEFQYTSKD